MPIPSQLPLEPTDNLFVLLASDRTGAQSMMSILDMHPTICASGEADKPDIGFPADVLLPDGLPWYPHCSIKRGCTFEFMKSSITEFMDDLGDNNTPRRCQKDYDKSTDPLADHIPRICKFIEQLNGNHENSNIGKLWVDAFVREDRSLVGCGCVRGVKAKGLKVLMEWMLPKGFPFDNLAEPFVDLGSSRAHGAKVIRLRRSNILARYKSKLLAKQTNVYQPANAGQKQAQPDSAKDLSISTEHMEWHMKQMEAIDKAADDWANQHGSEVLHIDYEDCVSDAATCYKKIFNFLGVDPSFPTSKKADAYDEPELEDDDELELEDDDPELDDDESSSFSPPSSATP